MRQTSRSARLPRQAIAGAALAALLAWAPFGTAAQAPAYADEPEAWIAAGEGLAAGEDVAFDDVVPEEEALAIRESNTPLDDEGTSEADAADPLAGTDETLVGIADAASLSDTDVAPLPDAVSLSDLDAALASGDPVAQVQALGIATDPSQVEGYDPAADEAPADYEDLVASNDEGISSQSDSSVRVGDWSYRESKNSNGQTEYTLNGYYGSATSVTLPATLDGKQMSMCYFGSTGLPKTLTSVTIPASYKQVGYRAFYNTQVASVTFAANSQLTSIGQEAFAYTPLTELALPAHVKTIGQGAFRNSKLTKLTLSAELEPMTYTVTVVSGDESYNVARHYNACDGCGKVTFVVPSGSKNYRVENGALLSKDGTVLYAQLSDLGGGTYTVPSGVKYIGSYAMCNNTTFSRIVLPQGLTTMEDSCLAYTGITSLDMPDSVTHVQGSICEQCTSLTSVRISNNLEELGESAGWECFYGCTNLTSLTLGSKLRVIGNSCFAESKLTSVNLPASLEQLNYGAFGDTPTLKSVTGGAGLRYIYSYAFRNAAITSFPFGKGLRFVADDAFKNCKFTPSFPSYMNEGSDGHYAYDGVLTVRANKHYSLAWQVLDLVNQERAKQGLKALTMDADLLDTAMQRAAETSICFSHTRPIGQDCFSACSKMTRENIASGLNTAQGTVNQWMNSRGHRANILSSDSKSVGIGCVQVTGRYFWVMCFGTADATTVTRPANTSSTIMKVPYTTEGLASFGSRFEVYAVVSNGDSVTLADGALVKGKSQRYSLFTYPWGTSYNAITRIDDSCVTWSLAGTGAKLDASKATVTGTGNGSFTITASVGDGTVKQSLTRQTTLAIYTVTFNSNGGSNTAIQSVIWGEKATKPTNPTREGGTFIGWYSDSALTKAYDFNSAVKSNLTLYAKWKLSTYTVSFNTNGGSAVASQTVTWGSKATKPTNPTKSGYAFSCWYSDSALTKPYYFTDVVKSNLTLYAKWYQKLVTSFKDVPSGEWYASWVSKAAMLGLMQGHKGPDGNYTGYFEPNGTITRAQVATVLWRISGKPSSSSAAFSDMSGHWAAAAVAWCNAKGIVTGYTGGPDAGKFVPDRQVSRQELAVMVWRFAKYVGVKTANPPTSAFYSCGDTWSVPDWSRDAMVWCAAAGVITGVQGGGAPMLCPEAGATRAMAAKIFVRTDDIYVFKVPYTTGDIEAETDPDDVTFDDARVTQVTYEQTDEGLAYALVPEGATDGQGAAYVLGQAYAELGGRYVGPGLYVTGYTGESAALALPAQIEGSDVVSANLSWKGNAEAGTPDPDGRTRLERLTVERGCKLASLDASGSSLAGFTLTGDEALGGLDCLRYLDLSGTQVASLGTSELPALEELALRDCPLTRDALAELASWCGATGLTADLTGAGQKTEQSCGANAGQDANKPAANVAVAPDGAPGTDATFDAVEPGATSEADDGSVGKAEQADETGDISTTEAGKTTGTAESTGNDGSEAAGDPDVNAASADSADAAEPDAATDAFAESDEVPAADAADAPGLEAVSFDSFDDAFAA